MKLWVDSKSHEAAFDLHRRFRRPVYEIIWHLIPPVTGHSKSPPAFNILSAKIAIDVF